MAAAVLRIAWLSPPFPSPQLDVRCAAAQWGSMQRLWPLHACCLLPAGAAARPAACSVPPPVRAGR